MPNNTPITLRLSRHEALALRDLIAESLRMSEATAPTAIGFHGRAAYGALSERLHNVLIAESLS